MGTTASPRPLLDHLGQSMLFYPIPSTPPHELHSLCVKTLLLSLQSATIPSTARGATKVAEKDP